MPNYQSSSKLTLRISLNWYLPESESFAVIVEHCPSPLCCIKDMDNGSLDSLGLCATPLKADMPFLVLTLALRFFTMPSMRCFRPEATVEFFERTIVWTGSSPRNFSRQRCLEYDPTEDDSVHAYHAAKPKWKRGSTIGASKLPPHGEWSFN